jgi:transposase-like protein
MRERFCTEELQAMIDLYISGATRSQVAERFDISMSSVKRLLRNRGIRKRGSGHTVVTRHGEER